MGEHRGRRERERRGGEAARREEEVPPGVAAERRWLHGEAYLAVEHVHARIGSGQSAQTPPGEDADWNAVRRTEM